MGIPFFVMAVGLIILWAATYPIFLRYPNGFDTWQLVINTLTTIITFLMVFLIQNTQNRDAKAIHLKLDELIHKMHSARDEMVSVEKLSDAEMGRLEDEFERIHKTAQRKVTNETPPGPPSPQ